MYPIGLHIFQLISQGCEQDVGKGESQQLPVQHLPLMANQTDQRRPAFYGDLREGEEEVQHDFSSTLRALKPTGDYYFMISVWSKLILVLSWIQREILRN